MVLVYFQRKILVINLVCCTSIISNGIVRQASYCVRFDASLVRNIVMFKLGVGQFTNGYPQYGCGVRFINDWSGEKLHQKIGLTAYEIFTQDWVSLSYWEIMPFWIVRSEYLYVHGTSIFSSLDKLNICKLALDESFYALQVAFRFK